MPFVLRSIRFSLVALIVLSPLATPATAAPTAPVGVRLYTLDCGTLEFKDTRSFSDTGEYDGQTATIAVPCFLIRHPKGTLVWDTGLDPKFVQRSDNGARGIRATLFDRVERIVANTKARLVIQHDPEDFKALPKFPEYLE
jgi:hypothetical protein